MKLVNTTARNRDTHENKLSGDAKDAKDTRDMEQMIEEVKLLIIKRQKITSNKNDQGIGVKTSQNTQTIIDYWIENNQIEGVKGMIEPSKILKKFLRL